LCGLAMLWNNDSISARKYVQAALSIAQPLGNVQSLAAEVYHTPLLNTVITPDMPGYSTFIHDFSQLRGVHHQDVPRSVTVSQVSDLTGDTYGLRVYTLGSERIERDGVRVTASVWRAAKARELFLYLLFNGAQSRERICADLWPEASAAKARQNFHTTLHRARQALGNNVIAFDEEIYRLNPDVEIWCDARELENLVRQTRGLSRRDARAEDLLRRAVGLYKSDFLLSLDQSWVTMLRDHLRDVFFDALVGLGECARARGDFRAAIAAYKRAQDMEPYREDIMCAVMTCYSSLGDKSQVLSHLHKLRAVLWEDLAIEPSPETLALARNLLT
ncbi:MAG: hypothetical protein K8I30_01925, partial [Anaerolineae bacterium]|nr:hypothetical protein [Anaerolineae bacterium]